MLSTVIWLFFSQLSKRDSVRGTLAAVVVLLLKFSRPFTNGIGCFMAFSLESSISFLMSIFRRNLTVPFFKFYCFFVVLVVSNFFVLNMKQFEANNSVLFNLPFVCTIITLVNLNFKYHTKILLCSQANQNHPFEICFRS